MIQSGTLCAGDFVNGGVDSCQGDSGMCKLTLIKKRRYLGVPNSRDFQSLELFSILGILNFWASQFLRLNLWEFKPLGFSTLGVLNPCDPQSLGYFLILVNLNPWDS